MPDHNPAYVDTLAGQLRTRNPDALDAAEDDLALLRARLTIVARFIHDPTHDREARQALARDLHIPGPA
jgi:hypothetical protein